MTVLVVGDIVTDVLAVHTGPVATGSDTPARITIGGGGSAANTASWLAALRVPVMLVGVVGHDEAGAARLAELTAAGVRCAVRRVDGAATGTVVVLSSGDERTMLTDRAANLLLTSRDVTTHLTGARHLHLSGYVLLDERTRGAGRDALAAARAAGLTTSVDAASADPLRRIGGPAFRSWVRETDVLLANLDEARVLAGDGTPVALASALAADVVHAVVKCGAAGAVWVSADGTSAQVTAPKATAVDPTGAGDAFAAGLLSAWLTGAGPRTCLEAGASAGAAAVRLVGGRPDPPRADPGAVDVV
jgi:ribokinase